MSRYVKRITRRYKSPLRGIGAAQLDILDSMRSGVRTLPDLVEDTGRCQSVVYESMKRLQARGFVWQSKGRTACHWAPGTVPSEWKLTALGATALKLARQMGRV